MGIYREKQGNYFPETDEELKARIEMHYGTSNFDELNHLSTTEMDEKRSSHHSDATCSTEHETNSRTGIFDGVYTLNEFLDDKELVEKELLRHGRNEK